MEKVMYAVTRHGSTGVEQFGERLRGTVAEDLIARGARGVQVNLVDPDVAPADGLRIVSSDHPAEAIVSVWVDSAVDHLRAPFDLVVGDASASVAAYLVTESVPLPNTRHPAQPGRRTEGMAQVVFLQRPEHLSVAEWLDIWHNSHTRVALDTQDTFGYVQNVVTRVLTPGVTPWDAIVEECFPAGAMSDPHVFFDAVGDDERLRHNQRAMFESVQRFLDFARMDVIPTSQYVIRPIS